MGKKRSYDINAGKKAMICGGGGWRRVESDANSSTHGRNLSSSKLIWQPSLKTTSVCLNEEEDLSLKMEKVNLLEADTPTINDGGVGGGDGCSFFNYYGGYGYGYGYGAGFGANTSNNRVIDAQYGYGAFDDNGGGYEYGGGGGENSGCSVFDFEDWAYEKGADGDEEEEEGSDVEEELCWRMKRASLQQTDYLRPRKQIMKYKKKSSRRRSSLYTGALRLFVVY